MNGPEWCTIESDPGVFTELIAKFGVEGVEVEELYGLDNDLMSSLSPIYGLIFLFRWDKDIQQLVSENVLDVVPDGVFFAKQVIDNACATQAILSVLLNSSKSVQLGKTLSNFLSFTSDLDPESRGLALQSCEEIRLAHNSFSRPEPISIEKTKDDEKGDAFHFISYVPINGFLYEMDGLQPGPRLIGDCDPKTWYIQAKEILQSKMAQYGNKELRFTLLAVCQNLEVKYMQEITALQLKKGGDGGNEYEFHDNEYILNFEENQIDERVVELEKMCVDVRVKYKRWTKENIRRRHNYFPFVFKLIEALADNNLLEDIVGRAVEKKKGKLKSFEEEKKSKEDKGDGKVTKGSETQGKGSGDSSEADVVMKD